MSKEQELIKGEMVQKNPPKCSALEKKSIVLWIFCGILALLLAVYVGISLYFMNHFIFRTTINGTDVSACSLEQVQQSIEAGVSSYELTLYGRGGLTDTITGEDVSLSPVWDGSLEQMLREQNGFLWIIKLFVPDAFSCETFVTYDDAKLEEVLKGLSCMQPENQTAPADAAVSEYSEGGYALIPAEQGSTIIFPNLKSAAESAILMQADVVTLEDVDCYEKPAVDDEDPQLLSLIDTLNLYADAVITYEIGDITQVLDASVFHEWLSVAPDYTVTIDEGAVSRYVDAAAETYNTAYQRKKFMTTYGQEVVLTTCPYGWRVDRAAERAAIMEEIQNGVQVTRDFNYSMTANSHGEHDYGNSYVEINLTAQHLFLYKDGTLVMESDLVSGDLEKGNATPTGVYGITYMQRDAIINVDSFVSYWMPFNRNVGMHDASWKSTFGASIYKRDGSHGCINLPYDSAKTIYENVSPNFPVIVYELPGTETAQGIAQDQAYAVIDAIKAIDSVSLESEPLIVSARMQYDALSDEAKGFVTNYQTLLNAETVLAQLKELSVGL